MGSSSSRNAVARATEFSTAGKNLPQSMSREDIYYHDFEDKAYLVKDPYLTISAIPLPSQTRQLPVLPLEIWERIFVHVRRRIGLIKGKGKLKMEGDYNQMDLVNLMLVCRRFYYIAAPILYARVITNKPHLLFYGLDHKSISFPDQYKRWSKLDLLQLVHRLDLIYTSSDVTEKQLRSRYSRKDRDILYDAFARGQSGRHDKEIDRMIMDLDSSISAVRLINRIRTMREYVMKSKEPLIMSNLDILTMSHPTLDPSIYTGGDGLNFSLGNKDWPRYTLMEDKKLDRYRNKVDKRTNPLGMISGVNPRLQFSYELSRLSKPKFICMDDTTGPYSYRRFQGSYDKIKSDSPEIITVHIYPRSIEKFTLPPKKDGMIHSR
ncbi:uncharacterized protein IL334_003904 [Kwoniella shivajii]|uniref:F-box domain-containing protein n=1 Tax=Kwoniella shivajii TaxID=564305 RepID=A0ABZ1CYW5_9TREE|nr:hypothetical protein IL334_003904 [Kwoniella shivajii]